MSQPLVVPIPDWAFGVARSLCEARQRRYRHRFRCGDKKLLKNLAGDDPVLANDIEGVFGYMCDITACAWLGLDAKDEMRAMIADTDLLTHRDEYDLLYRGWRVDVKMEVIRDEQYEKVVAGTIEKEEPYGCRLINVDHLKENSDTVDIYVFSTIDAWDPREAKNWIPLGWVFKDDVTKICPDPKSYVPTGARLWTRAYIIPHGELRSPSEFPDIDPKAGAAMDFRKPSAERIEALGKDQYTAILERTGLA